MYIPIFFFFFEASYIFWKLTFLDLNNELTYLFSIYVYLLSTYLSVNLVIKVGTYIHKNETIGAIEDIPRFFFYRILQILFTLWPCKNFYKNTRPSITRPLRFSSSISSLLHGVSIIHHSDTQTGATAISTTARPTKRIYVRQRGGFDGVVRIDNPHRQARSTTVRTTTRATQIC